MGKLILLRHGASVWNDLNIFTGWVDIPLSIKGIDEALKAGLLLARTPIDLIFSSALQRCLMTVALVLSTHESKKIPLLLHPGEGKMEEWGIIYDRKTQESCIPLRAAWQLNERMYGELQGMNKDEMRKKFGEEQVHLWRRSYDVAPPKGESLKMTAERAIAYFDQEILPQLALGKNIFICAHGNSLRGLIMKFDRLSEKEIPSLEIPTGVPLLYTYDQGTLRKDAIYPR